MSKKHGEADRGLARRLRSRTRPGLERFEDRLLMTVFSVTNVGDSSIAVADDGSLRGAILASNASATALPNTIVFNLPAGVQTISPVAPLPPITQQVLIDGSTATGFTNTPLIQISGNNRLNTAGPAFTVNSSAVTIKDLIINNFNGDGIDLNANNDSVQGCYIGVDPTGSVVARNTGVGILVGGSNAVIGSTSTNPNVISGNATGIQITGGNATRNLVVHSYIGTDATGQVKLGNTFDGIDVSTTNNTIGGISGNGPLGSGNLISGNNGYGISISNLGPGSNLVQGNYIGTNLTGLSSIGNSVHGILVLASSNNTIGGTTPGAGNVISGNAFDGILVQGAASRLDFIQGNLIGVGSDKTTPLGNGDTGVFVLGASQVTVGGSTFLGNSPQFGNIIAYNGNTFNTYGVQIQGGNQDGILSNRIFNNANIGIKLFSANAGIKPPTLISVQSGPAQTRIMGTYSGSPNTQYRIQFFASQAQNPSGSGDGQNYLGDLDITTDSTGNANFTTLLAQGVPVGAFVSSTATESVLVTNNTSQFGPNAQATQAQVTNLGVSVAVPNTGPFLSQNYTYTVTVTNFGPDDATGVTLTDVIPTSSMFVSSSAGTFLNGVLTADIGNLPSGASQVVTITVKPVSTAGSFTNIATVTGNELDSNGSNNSVTTTGTVATNSDLSVTLIPSVTTAPVGSPLTYILAIGNNGPSTANGTVATVTFPSTFTNIVVTTDQGSFTVDASNTVTINTGILPASSSSNVVIRATPTVTGISSASASVTSSLPDPNPANNTTGSVDVLISNAADLAVVISADPNPVLIGQELIYTIIVSNNGPSAASSPVLTDILPSSLTYVPIDSSVGSNGTLSFDSSTGTVTATLNPLLAGASFTITIAVIPNAAGSVTNTVSVGDPDTVNPVELDTDLTNNSAFVATQVSPSDVGVTIISPTDPLFIGTQAVYQVVVNNNGPATADSIHLVNTFGAGVTILSTSVGTINGNTVTADLGPIAGGASITVFINVSPSVSGRLVDSAQISTPGYDPLPNNDSSTSTNLVSPVDLFVSVVTDATALNLVNHPITYTYTITNAGPAAATNVLFSDLMPVGASIVSFTSSQGSVQPSGGSLTGNLGTINAGSSATVTIVLNPSLITTLIDTANVSSDNLDTVLGNNTATTVVGVTNLPGTVQFSTPVAFVTENAGFVTLQLSRTGGSLGAISVDYFTSNFTAVAGVNFTGSFGTVAFLDGQTSATITIPILDDFVINGTNGFFVSLQNPGGGASIGSASVTAVLVSNIDRDTIPPVVAGLIAIPNGSKINGFVITFSEPMDAIRAGLRGNYHVYLTSNKGQREVPLSAAVYDPFSNSVTLVPTSPLPANRFYHIVADGNPTTGLTDTSGNPLLGSTGIATNYEAFYGQGNNLVYTDSHQNTVTIKLSGGGTISIFRDANGDASVVNLFGIVPHKSRLTGSVKKQGKRGTGQTNIGQINGFGQFGDVFSTLTTPSFYVGSAPVTSASIYARNLASAAAPKPTPAVVTPQGPLAKKKK